MNLTELLKKAKEKSETLKHRAKTIKPKAGENSYVLLRGWRKGEEEQFWHDFGLHFIKDETGALRTVYPCADKTYGEPCEVCKALSQASKEALNDEQIEVLKEATANQTYLLNVLSLNTGDDNNTPQILEVGKTVFGQLLDVLGEWGEEIFDDENPRIIKIIRDGVGINTKYNVQIGNKKHVLPSGVFDKLNNLDDYVKQESEEGMRKALNAIGGLTTTTKAIGTTATSSGLVINVDLDDEDDLPFSEASKEAEDISEGISLDAELDELLADVD